MTRRNPEGVTMPDTTDKIPSAEQTEFLLSSAIGHAEQPGVLPAGVVQPIQHLLRNVMYYRPELAGSWIEAAGQLAEEILSIEAAPRG